MNDLQECRKPPDPAFNQRTDSPEESVPQDQARVDWNSTDSDFLHSRGVHELFEEQVARTPEAVAVVLGNDSITYRELNSQANRLAHQLRNLGVHRDVLVGLCPQRSVEMVIGLLAILKAGGAYVPLDPDYPKERLAYMIEDAEMTVIVTQRHIAEKLPKNDAQYVWLDEIQSHEDPGPITCSPGLTDSLAYVIYTSGSTGKPKGVEIQHSALINCLWHFRHSLQITSTDVWLAVTTLSFDIAGLEIWLPLLCGARCVIATRETAMDGHLLAESLTKNQATILQATPVTWRMLLLAGWKGDPTLKLLCGGESMPQDLADQLAISGAEAWNVYGPTETTIWSTAKKIIPNEKINIGRPIANTQLYILDEKYHLVSFGDEGNLFIGGDGVARGYRNRPELTSQKFLPDPFQQRPGARIYDTGDRARWLPDGCVSLLGRADFQVKIRGYRIELGDIETSLRAHPSICEAAATVREDKTGEKQIVAYLVTGQAEIQDHSELTRALKETLPDYMIPSHFIVIPELPLTPNGKVDRKALDGMEGVEIGSSVASSSVASSGPKDLLEWEITKIWRRLFEKEAIDRHDNFFDLGGNSLLAAQLSAEIESLLQTKIAIASLFQSPTIAGLAERLTKEEWLPPWSSLVPLQPLGTKPPLFLIHGWGGDVYGFVELAKQMAPDQPTYGIQAVGLDGSEPQHESVSEMAAHYVREICSFQPEGPYSIGGYSSGGIIAYEVARQLEFSGRKIASLIVFDTDPIGMISLGNVRYVISRCLNRLEKWLKPAPPQQLLSSAPAKAQFGDYYHDLTLSHRMRSWSGPTAVLVSDESDPNAMAAWRFLVSKNGLTFRRIHGEHWQIIDQNNVSAVAEILRDVLDRASRQGPKALPYARNVGKTMGGARSIS